MTDLDTAKINSLTQDVQQLRVRLDGLIARVENLEDGENYRQQDEDAERAYESSTFAHTLVERVALAITAAGPNNLHQAKAAILVVAADLKEECAPEAAEWLVYEANHG